jgi:hypothetical protein
MMIASATSLKASSTTLATSTCGYYCSSCKVAVVAAICSVCFPAAFLAYFCFFSPLAKTGLSGKASLYIEIMPSRSFISATSSSSAANHVLLFLVELNLTLLSLLLCLLNLVKLLVLVPQLLIDGINEGVSSISPLFDFRSRSIFLLGFRSLGIAHFNN